MNSDKYFKIVSEFGNVIHIKPQGVWTDEIAEEFGQELISKFSIAVKGMEVKRRKFIVLANMCNFHVKGDKTKNLLTQLMKISGSHELFFRTVQIIPDIKTRHEIKTSSEKAGQTNIKFVVADIEEANAKLIELKKELLQLS